MRHLRNASAYTIAAAVSIALLDGVAACALQHGVSADPSVQPVPLSSFDGLSPSEMWNRIDRLEYWEVPIGAPPTFYASVDDTSGSTLRASLNDLIDDHAVFRYTHGSRPGEANHRVDVWDILVVADRHPDDDDAIIDVYRNATFPAQFSGVSPRNYDREHSWPKSYGFSKRLTLRNGQPKLVPAQTTNNPAWSDCHHLYAADSTYNSRRNNTHFDAQGSQDVVEFPTDPNLGRGGSLTAGAASSNFRTGAQNPSGAWQVWIGRRGDIARAMFYMDVRYDGDAEREPDLVLTNEVSLIRVDEQIKRAWELDGTAHLGMLDTLVQWHRDDPVDDLERRRNTVVFLFQGNRNPFVDRPEFVDIVFGSSAPQPSPGLDPEDDPGDDEIVALAVTPWINELHYDNSGSDVDEFVEIAGPAGLDLNGWTLVGYNGANGNSYKTVGLSGSIGNQQAGMGVVAIDFPGLQNGKADAIALVAPDGEVVEFISYEGTLRAEDGPAAGGVSTDIDVAESGATPRGMSLQRGGRGCRTLDFAWLAPTAATPGGINVGQEFAGCP